MPIRQFSVFDFGAVGDTKVASDVTTGNSTTLLSPKFHTTDSLKTILVLGGDTDASGNPKVFVTKAIGASEGSVTLNPPLPRTFSAQTTCFYGTDDTSAFTTALAAVLNEAQLRPASLLVPAGMYIVTAELLAIIPQGWDNFNFSLVGDGVGATQIVLANPAGGWAPAGLLHIDASAAPSGGAPSQVAVRNLSLLTPLAGGGSGNTLTAISMIAGGEAQQQERGLAVENVLIGGLRNLKTLLPNSLTNAPSGSAIGYWDVGILASAVWRPQLQNVTVVGLADVPGMKSLTDDAVSYRMACAVQLDECYAPDLSHCQLWAGLRGLQMVSTRNPGAEGFFVNECTVANCREGIYIETPGVEPQLSIRGGHLNNRDFNICLYGKKLAIISAVLSYNLQTLPTSSQTHLPISTTLAADIPNSTSTAPIQVANLVGWPTGGGTAMIGSEVIEYQAAAPAGSFYGSLTSSSNIVTSVSSFDYVVVGSPISGSAIPAGTTVTAIDTANSQLTMSNAAGSGFTNPVTISSTAAVLSGITRGVGGTANGHTGSVAVYPPTVTTLTTAVNAADHPSTLVLLSTLGFPRVGAVLIGSEWFSYDNLHNLPQNPSLATTLYNVARAKFGTVAGAWGVGTLVYGSPADFLLAGGSNQVTIIGNQFHYSGHPLRKHVQVTGASDVGVADNVIDAAGYANAIDSVANDVQTISASGSPSSGVFTLATADVVSSPLSYSATSAQVQAALQAIPSYGQDVTCSGGPLPGTPIVVMFGGAHAGRPQPLLAVDSSIVGGSVVVTHTTFGSGAGCRIKHNVHTPALTLGKLLGGAADTAFVNESFRGCLLYMNSPQVVATGPGPTTMNWGVEVYDTDGFFSLTAMPQLTGLFIPGYSSGGNLAAGTYYVKVTAVDNLGETAASAEGYVTIQGSTGRIDASCNPATGNAGAVTYRWYIGTSSGGEAGYFTSTAPSYTFTDLPRQVPPLGFPYVIPPSAPTGSIVTIPANAGIKKVRVTGQVDWQNNSSGDRGLEVSLDGAVNEIGGGRSYRLPVTDAATQMGVVSAVLPVVAGDVIRLAAIQTRSGAGLQINATNWTWFQVEVVEGG